jgi:manganese transport protein
MAAATFHRGGMTGVGTIEEAYKTLVPLLGGSAAVVFGVSLLVSGLSSSTVGTMAGQVMMQGFLRKHIAVWVRRVVTVIPSLIVIGAGVDATKALVLSQVFLSLGLPFAVIPLVMFTRRRDLMGPLTNRGGTTLLAWVMSGLIIALNVYLIYDTLAGG